MKEELQTKLLEIMTSIQTAAGAAGDFALAQLPEIAQSYVAYGRAVHTFAVVAAVALMVLAGFSLRCALKTKSDDVQFLSALGGVVSGTVGFIAFLSNFTSCLLVWFAPKVWLLKEIAQLVR